MFEESPANLLRFFLDDFDLFINFEFEFSKKAEWEKNP